MAKFAWCTDVHLDFLGNSPDGESRLNKFATELVVSNPNGVFITGDISTAKNIVLHLSMIERVVQRPIYFVLGNHDYYGGQIEDVRKQMKELSGISPFLKYLPTTSYVPLTPATAVLGHDAWYDALYGDWRASNFVMQDWSLIHDFAQKGTPGMYRGKVHDMTAVVALARKLAHEGVVHTHDAIKSAVRYHSNVVVLTHYPPFEEAHLYQGQRGTAGAQPWYTCKMMGDMLKDAAKAFPKVNFTVLSGHTHGKYHGKISPNLEVHVGGAEYGSPQLQEIFELP